MTLEKANELIAMHVEFGSGYNRNATKMILAEVDKDHGQIAVDKLINDFDLTSRWQINQGTKFTSQFD